MVENPGERGDLIIRFKIEFPLYLTTSSKIYVKKAFRTSSAVGDKGDAEYIQRLVFADKFQRNVDSDAPFINRQREDAICNL